VKCFLDAKSGQTFALWRLGQWRNARENSCALLPLVKDLVQRGYTLSDKLLEEYCFNICRVYIEICVDDLQLMPSNLIIRMAQEWDIDVANELLSKLHHPNPQDHLLAQIAKCQVEWATGQHDNINQLENIIQDCMDRQYLNAAWAAVRLTLRISFKTGLHYYKFLNRALGKVHRTHYIWKNRESLFIAAVMHPGTKPGVLRYLFMKYMLTLLYSMRANYVELRHRYEASRWTVEQQKWENSDN
jgi:hypothetical protein